MKKTTTLRASILIASLFIAACGNKGDLYLTEKPTAKPAEQTQEQSTEQKKN